MNKLRCYLNYFERISSGYPDLDKKISILRLCIENNDLPDYDNLKIKMSKVEILDSGTIEEIDKEIEKDIDTDLNKLLNKMVAL